MRAAVVHDGHIVIEQRPVPSPGSHEVLVQIAAAGVNRADLMQRLGFYPAPPGSPADIPGLEFAGTVAELGPEVSAVAVGDRVFGVVGGGAQAQYLCVHETHCAIVPDTLDFITAGGVPEAFVTAHDAMVTQAAVQPNDWVLIHAIGSGVGTTALQLARAFNANVIGTARTAAKLEQCTSLGLAHGIVAPSDDAGRLDVNALNEAVRAIAPNGTDIALDLVGGPYLEAEIACAAQHGRIVLIGTLAGGRTSFDILATMQKFLTIRGTVLRPRNVADKAAATAAFVRDVVPLLAAGAVAPIIESVMPLAEAEQAYDLLGTDTTFGKIVLDCS